MSICTHVSEINHGANVIGKGSEGSVEKIIQDGKAYALKKIEKNAIRKLGRLGQLMREIEIMKAISHENVVKFVKFIDTDPTHYKIKMEFCEGQTLKDFLLSSRYRQQILPTRSKQFAIKVCLGYLDALVYMRRHMVVNRDIKPDNIVVDVSNQGKVKLKMIDFGEACVALEWSKSYMGTHGYMSPEIFFGHGLEKYSDSCDCWSFGVVLYELFEGIKSNLESQKTFPSPFQENFFPSKDDQYKKIYNEKIYEGVSLLQERTPAPFQKIIRGLFNPHPAKRMTIKQVTEIIDLEWHEIGKEISDMEQRQHYRARINLCLVLEKQTSIRKRLISQQKQKLKIIYNRLYVKFIAKIGNSFKQHIEEMKLVFNMVKRIEQSFQQITDNLRECFAQVLTQNTINEEWAIDHILSDVMNKEDYEEVKSRLATYTSYFCRHKIQTKYKLEKIHQDVSCFIRKHYLLQQWNEIFNLVQTLLLD